MRTIFTQTIICLMAFLVGMTAMVPVARADVPGQSVRSIEVSGLGNYQGRSITAIYARGFPSTAETENRKEYSIVLRQIRIQKTEKIIGDTVIFPAVLGLTWNGLMVPYNYVIFVVHADDGVFQWINKNGFSPEGAPIGTPTVPVTTVIIKVDILTKGQLEALPVGNANMVHHSLRLD